MWLALATVPGLGPASFALLLRLFGTPDQVFRQSAMAEEALVAHGYSRARAAAVVRGLERADPAACVIRGDFIILPDREYPELLRQTATPPPVLFLRGRRDGLAGPAVAVVGSRHPTHYGASVARSLARELAAAGITVVSGLARGIDAEAHRSALEAGGRTVAVLGCGVDRCYPPEHEYLCREIESAGAVVSELPWGAPPVAANFPRRNRIIAGMSLATVVVEAGEKSGALITANQALEENRLVGAVPGSVFSPLSEGTHKLLKDGAILVRSARDVIEELAALLPSSTFTAGRVSSGRTVCRAGDGGGGGGEGDGLAAVLQAVGFTPVHADALAVQLDLPAREVSAVLFELELDGLVRRLPGGYYVRT